MAENGSSNADSKPPVSDIENSVSFVKKGCKLTKFGSNGKRYQRFFFVDQKTMALCYTGSRKRPHNVLQVWTPIRKIADVVKVSDKKLNIKKILIKLFEKNTTENVISLITLLVDNYSRIRVK